jgi:predicted P-loop ATPase
MAPGAPCTSPIERQELPVAAVAGFTKADQFAVKNLISKQEERARDAYAQFHGSQPRVCIFIGTFNTTDKSELVE